MLETDSVVTESNEDFGVNKPMPDMYVWNSSDKTKANANKYYNEKIKLSQPVVVDPAGTSISDALLIRRYSFRINKTSWTSGEYYIDGGTMLAPCMATEDGGKTTANSPKRAYIDKTKIGTGEDPVVNRTNAFKAIEDIMSAGFKFTGCTYDPASTSLETNNGSVGKRFSLIMYCSTVQTVRNTAKIPLTERQIQARPLRHIMTRKQKFRALFSMPAKSTLKIRTPTITVPLSISRT